MIHFISYFSVQWIFSASTWKLHGRWPCSGPYWLWRKKTNKNQCKNFVWDLFFKLTVFNENMWENKVTKGLHDLCNVFSGVSIKIEVASRFEKLYQKRGFYSPSSRGVWGYAAHENSKFQCPKMRFPVPWSLSWVQKMMYFQSVWTSNVE